MSIPSTRIVCDREGLPSACPERWVGSRATADRSTTKGGSHDPTQWRHGTGSPVRTIGNRGCGRQVVTAVLLRPAVRSDAEFLFSMASDIEVVRWIGDGKPWTAEYFDRRFERALSATNSHEPDVQRWFVGTTDRQVRVGLLSTVRRSDHLEVGYWVHPDHWGRGYAGQFLVHAQELAAGLPLTAQVYSDNGASRRVLERAGFTLVDDGDLLTYRRRPTPGLTTS